MNKQKVILEIFNLKKFFVNKGNVNKAVDDVSFDVKEGEIVGLIGESGSGKTTIGRSLLRLYDDFNGFVRLDGQLISGKRISRKTRKFMRKNIQMIFQDPMATLNGQHTIFSILKEPLVVNKIIKNKIKDLDQNWSRVKENFHYSFLEAVLKLKLENLQITNSVTKPFSEKWNKILSEVNNFSNDETSYDDKFNSYFSFLEEKNKNNSKIINNLYSNTDLLISLYHESKAKLDANQIDFDESAYYEALAKYTEQLKLSKKTKAYYEYKTNRQSTFKNFKLALSNWWEEYSGSKNSVKNILAELKNEARLNWNEAYNSYDLDLHAYKLKLHLLNKKVQKILSKNQKNLTYLTFNELQELIKSLEDLSLPIFEQKLNLNLYDFNSLKSYKQELVKIIKQEYQFDFSKYTNISNERKKTYKTQLNNQFKNFIKYLKLQFKEFFVKPAQNTIELNKAKENFEAAKEIHHQEVSKYVLEFQTRINNLKNEIEKETTIWQKLKTASKANNELFNLTHKKFKEFYKSNRIKVLETKIKEAKNSNKEALVKLTQKLKQAKIDLKVYDTNVQDKRSGIDSFDIELKYLNKDLNNTYVLLGVSKFDLWLNKQHKHLQKVITFVNKPFSLAKLKSLFTKITIYKSLEDVGLLKQFAYRYPHEFSGGQRQRIVIARALISEPKVIVADEPIASLDISIQAQIVNLLKDLCFEKNIGMVFIAHDLSMIEYIADRVQIMHFGKIVESGDTNEIYQNPIHPYTIKLFNAIPKVSNANEKFKDVKFELEYLKEQQYPNIPTNMSLNDNNDHFVYATKDQFVKWTKPKSQHD
ncbi:peptide ABC transporter ATP-binding protein [Mycoplasmopsis bovirhinis]|uniref:ATP-binding cassette domain-containing protein n=1 Tax=Mycoplasmopsis bovirhinis TaxID=29553 RepID=UPI000C05A733|nr:ATP-binding cassette domain-containing protein [Mycoplasmopsis bovirhinis]ATO30991.1 peptide ABC transporter ATP-binding protein [Mycoplasmopsis bovirhinis]